VGGLDTAFAQVRDHPVDILLGYAERDMGFRRVAVHYLIYLEEPEHPASVAIREEQQGAWSVLPADAQVEPELLYVEVDGATQVRYREMNLVEAVMQTHAGSILKPPFHSPHEHI